MNDACTGSHAESISRPFLGPLSLDRTVKGTQCITGAEGLQTLGRPWGVEPWVRRLCSTLPCRLSPGGFALASDQGVC